MIVRGEGRLSPLRDKVCHRYLETRKGADGNCSTGGGLPGPLPLLNYFIDNAFLKEAVLCNLWSAVIYWLGCKNSYVSFLFIMNLPKISS